MVGVSELKVASAVWTGFRRAVLTIEMVGEQFGIGEGFWAFGAFENFLVGMGLPNVGF